MSFDTKCNELQEQIEVLADTVDMLSPLMMENRKLKEENKELKKQLLKYKAKEALNRKLFDFVLRERKNGTKFIKIIYYSNERDGWVEVARINLSKDEWVQNTFSMQDILEELKG